MINRVAKREEVVDVLRRGKFEFLDSTETRSKGNGELSWCSVNGINAGVQDTERTREDVATLLNDAWQSGLVEFGCVSTSVLLVKFKFPMVTMSRCSVWPYR